MRSYRTTLSKRLVTDAFQNAFFKARVEHETRYSRISHGQDVVAQQTKKQFRAIVLF